MDAAAASTSSSSSSSNANLTFEHLTAPQLQLLLSAQGHSGDCNRAELVRRLTAATLPTLQHQLCMERLKGREPARVGAAYVVHNGDLYMVGGGELNSDSRSSNSIDCCPAQVHVGNGDLMPLYRYDEEAAVWDEVSCLRATRSARRHHTAVVQGGQLWVFGGVGALHSAELDDIHRYDFATGRWSTVQQIGYSKGPKQRSRRPAAVHEACLLLYGGPPVTVPQQRLRSAAAPQDSLLYCFDLRARHWSMYPTEGELPAQPCTSIQALAVHNRSLYALVCTDTSTSLEANGSMEGSAGQGVQTQGPALEVYRLCLESLRWSRVPATGAAPPAQRGVAAAVHGGGWYISAGSTAASAAWGQRARAPLQQVPCGQQAGAAPCCTAPVHRQLQAAPHVATLRDQQAMCGSSREAGAACRPCPTTPVPRACSANCLACSGLRERCQLASAEDSQLGAPSPSGVRSAIGSCPEAGARPSAAPVVAEQPLLHCFDFATAQWHAASSSGQYATAAAQQIELDSLRRQSGAAAAVSRRGGATLLPWGEALVLLGGEAVMATPCTAGTCCNAPGELCGSCSGAGLAPPPAQVLRWRPQAVHQAEPPLNSALYGGLGDALRSAELADVTLVAEGRSLPCHRVVLAAGSPVFRRMLLGGCWRENATGIIRVGEMRFVVLEALVAFMYGALRCIDNNMVPELLAAADRFDVAGLARPCRLAMCQELPLP